MRVSRSWSRLPQLTPMRTGLAMAAGGLDHLGELRVALAAAADVAGIDAVLVERLGAGRVCGEQLVAVEVEVADQRHRAALGAEPVADVRDRGGRLVGVDRHAHQLGSRLGELAHLARRRCDVRRVGIGHRLDDDRRAAADLDGADADCDRGSARLDHFAFCAAIQASTFRSTMSSGTAPVESTVSWKARMSNLSPSAAFARSRSSRNFSWPIL